MTCAQKLSTFFEANYAEKLANEAVDRILLTGVGSKVKKTEEMYVIRHITSVVEGIDECWTPQRESNAGRSRLVKQGSARRESPCGGWGWQLCDNTARY